MRIFASLIGNQVFYVPRDVKVEELPPWVPGTLLQHREEGKPLVVDPHSPHKGEAVSIPPETPVCSPGFRLSQGGDE